MSLPPLKILLLEVNMIYSKSAIYSALLGSITIVKHSVVMIGMAEEYSG
jgi:hypothetical protein